MKTKGKRRAVYWIRYDDSSYNCGRLSLTHATRDGKATLCGRPLPDAARLKAAPLSDIDCPRCKKALKGGAR